MSKVAKNGKVEEKDGARALDTRQKVAVLLKAAESGDKAKFQDAAKLLDEGHGLAAVAKDVKDGNGRGPLHFAALRGRDELCRYLLEEVKVPADLQDDERETPLLLACRAGQVGAASLLLENGADVKASHDKSGAGPIHHAAATGNTELLQLLLDHGADPNEKSETGPPIIWAAGHGAVELVRLLLEKGADATARSSDDVTAMLVGAAAGSTEIVRMLLEAGGDPNASAGGGVTPLHVAAERGDEKTVEVLLTGGADPNHEEDEGSKAIDAAAARNHRSIVEKLLEVTKPHPDMKDWSVDALLKRAEVPEEERSSAKPVEEASTPSTSAEDSAVPSPHAAEVEAARLRGNEAFRKKDMMQAVDAYTQALDMDPTNATILANRSVAWLRSGQVEQALEDARKARAVAPKMAKACYREGAALRAMLRFEDAAAAFFEGCQLEPDNKELVAGFQEAVEAGRKAHAESQAAAAKSAAPAGNGQTV